MAKKEDHPTREELEKLKSSDFDAEARRLYGDERYEVLRNEQKSKSEIIEIILSS